MVLPITIDKESHVPVYLQICRSLKERILSGKLIVGSKLPSTEALARSLGIARATVVKAYEDLCNQGYAEAVSGAGTFVSGRALKAGQPAQELSLAPSSRVSASEYAKRIEILGIRGAGSSVQNKKLNYGAPSPDMLPLKSWKQTMIKDWQSLEINDSDWVTEPFGLYRCRAAISDYLCNSKGLNCSPEQIMLFGGCKETFQLVNKLLLDAGDLVAVENPSYEDPRCHMKLSGVEVIPVNIDDSGMIVSGLFEEPRKPELVFVSPSQDPTGVIMSMSRRKELVNWACENEVLIFEEGWDSDYSYSPPLQPSLQSLDQGGNVIYNYCFWKLLYPMVSIGVLVLPARLIPLFERYRLIADIQFSMFEQNTLASFIQEGLLDRHLKRSKKIYERRRKALIEVLLSEFRGLVELPRQSAGLHLCLRFDEAFSSESLLQAGEQAGLPLVTTEPYYMQDPRKNEFLLSFALHSEDTITERVAGFAGILRKAFSL